MDNTWVLERLRSFGAAAALRSEAGDVSFADLAVAVEAARSLLAGHEVLPGRIVVLQADFTAEAIAMLIALYLNTNVVVPLYDPASERVVDVCSLVGAHYLVSLRGGSAPSVGRLEEREVHPLIARLNAEGEPGLVLISSGSTGKPKAMLLSLAALFDRYRSLEPRATTTMTFLLFDHIGGFNTVFHTLFSGGTLVPTYSRSVDDVCRIVQQSKVEILPTTPTFLNMLLVSRAHERFDLSSLSLITYGTEVMPESTLRRLADVFPGVRLKQTYGMSEIGILSTRSEGSRSLWLGLGGDVQHKVVDGVLWLKSKTAMRGYLNADSPFDQDGWLCTGDLVDQKDGQYRIIGRKESMINVGGLKVYPAEIESHLLQLEGVRDVLAWGKKNPVTGHVVAVRLHVASDAGNLDELSARVKQHCRASLEHYKVPRHIEFTTEPIHNSRYKKMSARTQGSEAR
jgi:acyl-CoA synthetase (AMP-forming)/AMP-acid ligase II